jgi:hypothetical protein
MAQTRYFGIRHHGPGSARSLQRALEEYSPDCVLIEGPPEADALLTFVGNAELVPPVALLSHCPEQSGVAAFHPFAEFSPEWQAIRHALDRGVEVRFIDLPMTHSLALQAQRCQADASDAAADDDTDAAAGDGDEAAVDGDEADDRACASASDDVAADTEVSGASRAPSSERPPPRDPLDWLAEAAGYADGESWWNHMVEERGDGGELFAAIEEAMSEVRTLCPRELEPAEQAEEAAREAHMRLQIRTAQKAGHERIAVVCGAWHVPALRAPSKASADRALLRELPKLKVSITWVPWTYQRLARRSGYGAGIEAPGWYEHLYRHADDPARRTIAWLARVAKVLREKDLDCSSAHLIEAARLADALAALRDRPAASLAELDSACRTVIGMGEALAFIDDALKIGDVMGQVPADVPTVPLLRDLQAEQKRLRLKAEALDRVLDLDLRKPNDLARSHLLHRLLLLGVRWGALQQTGRGSRGTFHEIWKLQWQPEFALTLIEASPWGQTLLEAATAKAVAEAEKPGSVSAQAELLDQVLLAELPGAVERITALLEARAAASGDAAQLLPAIAPLANIYRYGNVRQTDASQVARVLDGLIVRCAIGLPNACSQLADDAAEALREQLLVAHAAVALRDDAEIALQWRRALEQIAAREGSAALLRGVCSRLLLDDGVLDAAAVATALAYALSTAAEPTAAANWLDGFLNRNAMVLLHDDALFQLVDEWLSSLGDEHFLAVLPLVRRTFAAFEAVERRDLAQRAARGAAPARAGGASTEIDPQRAASVLPVLRELMGLSA